MKFNEYVEPKEIALEEKTIDKKDTDEVTTAITVIREFATRMKNKKVADLMDQVDAVVFK
jgi:hypothetical protein